MKSTYWQGLAVIAAIVLPFLLGFVLVLSPPPSLLGWGAWVSLVALPVVIILATWLRAIRNRDGRLGPAVQQGILLGCIAGMLFIGGIFFPYAGGLGGRGLADFGGGIGWFSILFIGLLICGLVGAVMGAGCGAVAWGLHRAFGAEWRGVVAAGAALLAASTAAGVSLALFASDGGQDGWSIDEARAFEGFTLLWVGDEYEGLPLRRIGYVSGEKVFLFTYGSCNPRGEGGCAPPLSVRIEPCNLAPPGRYLSPGGPGAPFEIRGVQAAFSPAGHLRVWTREVTVTLFAEQGLALEAAGALRLVSEGPEGAEKQLKPLGYPC